MILQSTPVAATLMAALAAINAGIAVYYAMKKGSPFAVSFGTGTSLFSALIAIMIIIDSNHLK